MGPGFETNSLLLLGILGVLLALGWALRKPLKRLLRYFAAWADRDRRAEELAKEEAAVRAQAEAEVQAYLKPPAEEAPLVQKTGGQP